MLCPKCNSKVADGSKFCTQCGCPLNTENKEQSRSEARQIGLNDPVIVENEQQLKAATKTNCAVIYLKDIQLVDNMKVFFSPIACLAWAVLLLVAMFNGLAIIAAIAFAIAVIGHALAFIRYFIEGKYKYVKYEFNGVPAVKDAQKVFYVHKKYVPYYELNNKKV